MAIGSFKLPNTAGSTVDPYEWIRPTDWLAMPTIGTQEFIGLLAITDDGSNHIALLCTGAYTVDWGDGVTENVATGIQANHSYTYSTISSGTLTTRGYKQVLVRVTPQAGQNLTSLNLRRTNPTIGKKHITGWLDMSINAPNISGTSLTLGGDAALVIHGMCERVIISSIGNISCNYLFGNFNSLQSVNLFNTSSTTNFTNMFYDCYKLKKVPLFNTSAATTTQGMFGVCISLKEVPLFDLSSVTNLASMFYNCMTLETIPLFNLRTNAPVSMANMFQSCTSLRRIPLLNTIAVTSLNSTFYSCGIETIPLLNTVAVTDFTNTFRECNILQTLPNLNTSAGTTFAAIFTNNIISSLGKAAFQGTRYAISYSGGIGMCLSQSAIVDIFNGLGTAVGAQTITVTNNPGRAALTAAEILIATSKGWTVV